MNRFVVFDGESVKVLFVSPFFEPAWAMGGMPKACAAWARVLAAQGVEVAVFTATTNTHGELHVVPNVPIDRGAFKVTYFPRWRWSGNRFISTPLTRACGRRTTNFDAVHVVGLWPPPSGVRCLAARCARVPFIMNMLCEMRKNGVRLDQDQFSPDRLGRLFAAFLEDVACEHQEPERI